jgi:hypothetical protein
MQEKAIEYEESIISSSLKRGVFAMAYVSCYMLSMGYGTVTTSLSMEECEEIQKSPGNAILPKMGKTLENCKRRGLWNDKVWMARCGSLRGSTSIRPIEISPGVLEDQRHIRNIVPDPNGFYTVGMWHGGKNIEL